MKIKKLGSVEFIEFSCGDVLKLSSIIRIKINKEKGVYLYMDETHNDFWLNTEKSYEFLEFWNMANY